MKKESDLLHGDNTAPPMISFPPVLQWLEKVRFRKALFGVSERDVWKKIKELDDLYRQALYAEHIRYEALLKEAKKKQEEETE